MNITVIGRGNVGGGLARRWEKASHTVMEIGRGGGDASDADAVLVALPSAQIADGLAKVSGLDGKITIDAMNAFGGTRSPESSDVRTPSAQEGSVSEVLEGFSRV